MSSRAMRQPLSLRLTSNGLLILWCVIAAFPIFWITVMSFKTPVDAFDANALNVIFGPETRAKGYGVSLFDICLLALLLWSLWRTATRLLPSMVRSYAPQGAVWLGWLVGVAAFVLVALVALLGLLPALSGALNPMLGAFGTDVIGLTTEHYKTVWIDRGFTNNFQNSLIVTAGVVTVSLTVGTLAGYGLARSGSTLAFWILIVALVFRALPHSVLVAGYLPVFINSSEWLSPILGENAPTLYGKPMAVIAVLVAINQPFTIWMLRSFFQNIPADLDEAARVDGCNHFQAFRRVIMPVMWPGVITTGLFSFLLAYNDFLVTSLLLDAQNQTMVPAIAGMFNRETTTTDQVVAVAAAVSITAPLFILVMVFQRQIVSGLTAGAVKG
jgi:trehalose/maltose transport system permease protein